MGAHPLQTATLTLLLLTTGLAGCLGINSTNNITDPSSEDYHRTKYIIAFDIKDDYSDYPETNPQALADYIAQHTGKEVLLYPVSSEGSTLEALRFGHADIAFMDGGAAWVGWKEYGLEAIAANQKSDGRTYYDAHAWVLNGTNIAEASLDDEDSTDPFSLFAGKATCHTGWLKSAGMLLPMGYMISNGYTEIIGDEEDIESLRTTIQSHFSEDSSIPDPGTPYYGYAGAVKCLSQGVGEIAFAKDSTISSYCGNENLGDNEEWCLPESDYIKLPSFGKAPSHPVMFNPERISESDILEIQNTLTSLNQYIWVEDMEINGTNYTGCYDTITHLVDAESPKEICGDQILKNVLNTPGLSIVTTEEHLGNYSSLISSLPGIGEYFSQKYEV